MAADGIAIAEGRVLCAFQQDGVTYALYVQRADFAQDADALARLSTAILDQLRLHPLETSNVG